MLTDLLQIFVQHPVSGHHVWIFSQFLQEGPPDSTLKKKYREVRNVLKMDDNFEIKTRVN